VKDRLALGVIEDAERTGALEPGQTVVEATSGNTGIGLAMVCAQKGYPLVVTMAETFSVERAVGIAWLRHPFSNMRAYVSDRTSGTALRAARLQPDM
jgi:hypothetical protein